MMDRLAEMRSQARQVEAELDCLIARCDCGVPRWRLEPEIDALAAELERIKRNIEQEAA